MGGAFARYAWRGGSGWLRVEPLRDVPKRERRRSLRNDGVQINALRFAYVMLAL
jgi:hypothetical protein